MAEEVGVACAVIRLDQFSQRPAAIKHSSRDACAVAPASAAIVICI